MALGYLAFVLHAHLPFVRHLNDPHALEERWLYEALTETYIPLLSVMDRLILEDIDYRLTMSVSPPLASMLADPLLQERYLTHLNKLSELVYKELDRTYGTPFHETVQMYHKKLGNCKHVMHKYGNNLNHGFKRFQDLGVLELITCGATHGYFPLNGIYKEAVRAQLGLAVSEHQRRFERQPAGLWVPECAYNPGDDALLKEYGLNYFFVDTHGILLASKQPRYGVYAPLLCPSGVAAFGRDMESSKQVWSASEGYPGDYNYREFYRDIGYDLGWDYIKDYVHPQGIRIDTGLKYYRITGRGNHKEPYVENWALERAEMHAANFVFNRSKQVEHLSSVMDRKPIIVSPYDAELFGHWWYEGPDFLYYLFKKLNTQDIVKPITPSDYLKEYPINQTATPAMSSWGQSGYHEVWLNQGNDWIYRHLHKVTELMIRAANTYREPSDLLRRALNQMARELLLAQSSDWAFIMKTGTMVEYANRRTYQHLVNALQLYDQVHLGQLADEHIKALETENNIFPNIDYRIYTSKESPKIHIC